MAKTPRRVVLGLVFLAVMIAALGAFENIRGGRLLRSYKAALIIQGEKLTIEQLSPGRSGEAYKAANDLVRASWQFRDGPILSKGSLPSMKYIGSGKARVTWREPDLRADRSTNQWSELAAELEQNSQVLKEIRKTLDAPAFNFNLNYSQGFNLLLGHLAKLKGVSQRLSAATLNDLHHGRLDDAAANLNALARLPEVFRDEPLIISQLVRIAIAAIAIGPTWEALQADGWADAQLAGIQKQWETLEFMPPMERAMEMERAMGIETFDRLRRSSAERKQAFGGALWGAPGSQQGLAAPGGVSNVPDFALELGKKTLSSAGSFGRETLWLWLWSCHDERRYLEMIQAMIEVPRQAQNTGAFLAARSKVTNEWERAFRLTDVHSPRYFLAYQIAPALEKASTKAARIETQKRLVLTAIALKRYQLRHRRPAPELAAIVPEFLPSVPRDFMDGEELRYRPMPDGGFLLYSVGEDGRDDGGDSRPPNEPSGIRYFFNGRDLVWPMPATAEEVAAAEEKELKRSAAPGLPQRHGLAPTNTPSKP